jgi:seryl-tRNA synthetase
MHGHVFAGSVQRLEDGRSVLVGLMPALCRALDRRIRQAAGGTGVMEVRCPDLIERAVLERAGYFEAFPDAATMLADTRYALQPAACYHCYALLTGQSMDRLAMTLAGRCYRRHDASPEHVGRYWDFTMREVVLVGRPEWVAGERLAWIQRATALAASLDLEVSVEVAADPFFGPAARGMRVLQQLKELKHEIRARIGEECVAIASVNLHESFFASRFALRCNDDSPAHSACAAFGLERWAAALLAQRGEAHVRHIAASEL